MTTATDTRLETLHAALVEKTAELTTSAMWLAYLAVASRFHRYSLNNLILILIQRPDATQVAGYRVWQSLGRQVRKGEQSIGIFAPMTRKREDENGDERTYVSGFRVVSVFDVSQTDGDPLPEPVLPVLLDGEAPEGLWDALKSVANGNGYDLQRGPSRDGENGYTLPSLRIIQVSDDLSDAQAVKTLAHEVAHMLLHCADGLLTPEARQHRGVAEVEAESVAHLVSVAHGLPTDAYTLPYVAGWSDGKPEVVAATAERVLSTARTILAVTQPEEVTPTPALLQEVS